MTTQGALRSTPLVTTLNILTALARPALGQDVTLQYRWSKGEEVKYRVVQQTTTARET
jgi:hypothetical protein